MKRLIAFIGFMTVCSSGWATNGFIQAIECGSATGAVNCALATNVTAGNTLIAYCIGGSLASSIATSTDTKGNVYTKVYATDLLTQGSKRTNVFYSLNVLAGATTVTCSELTHEGVDAIISEYASTVTASGFDVSASSSPVVNTLTALTSTNATTTASNDLVFGFCRDYATSVSAPNGTQRIGTANNYFEASQDAIVASPSSYASTWTAGASGAFWTCGEVAFKPTAAAATGGGAQMMKYERYE